MKKNRKNSTKSLLACAVLAGVLGSGFGMGMSMAEAAQMPVFGLWNEGMENNYAHWAFPQTVIHLADLTGGQTLNLSPGYYVLADDWVDSSDDETLVGSTLNLSDGAYLNGRNRFISWLNINLSGNACAENICDFYHGNLTMEDNSKISVNGSIGLTAGGHASATVNGGEMICNGERQSNNEFIINGTVRVGEFVESNGIKVGPQGILYLGKTSLGRSASIMNEGTVYGSEIFLEMVPGGDGINPTLTVWGGKVVLQPDLVLKGEDYQTVSKHFVIGEVSDVQVFADDVKLRLDVERADELWGLLDFKFSDPIKLVDGGHPLQPGSTLVVQPNFKDMSAGINFAMYDVTEFSKNVQVIINANDSLYTLKCPESYVFGGGNRIGTALELEILDAEVGYDPESRVSSTIFSNQSIKFTIKALEPFSTEWFDYKRHVLGTRDYAGDYALFQTDELCYRTAVTLGGGFLPYADPDITRVLGNDGSERSLTVYGNGNKLGTGGVEINGLSTLTLENVSEVSFNGDLVPFADDAEWWVARTYAFRNGGTLNLKDCTILKNDILQWNRETNIVGTTNIEGVLTINGYESFAQNASGNWERVDVKEVNIENKVNLLQGAGLHLSDGISLNVKGDMTTEQGVLIEGKGADSVLTVDGNLTAKGMLSTIDYEDSKTHIHVKGNLTFDATQHSPVYVFVVGQGRFTVDGAATGDVRLLPYLGSSNALAGKDKVKVFTGGNLDGLTLRNAWVTHEATQQTYLLTQNEEDRGSLDVKPSRHNAVVGIRSHKGDFVNETAILFATNETGGRGTCGLGSLVRLAPVSGDMTTIEPLVDDAYLSKEQQTERVTGDIGIDGVELDGGKVKVQYSGALFVDDKSYISMLIADGDVAQDYFAYGNLTKFDRGGSGTVAVDLGSFYNSTTDTHGYALTFFNEYGNGTSFAGELNYLPGAFTLNGANLIYTAAADKVAQNIKVGKNNVVELIGTGTLNKVISGEGKVSVKDNITANGDMMQADFETASGKTMNISGGDVKGSLKGSFNLTGNTAFSGNSLQGTVSGDKKLILNNDVQINGVLSIANLEGSGKTLDMRQTTGTVNYDDTLTIGKLWSNANWAIDVGKPDTSFKSDKIVLNEVVTGKTITLNAINLVGTLTENVTTIAGVVSGAAIDSVNVASGLFVYGGGKKYSVTLEENGFVKDLKLSVYTDPADIFKDFVESASTASFTFTDNMTLNAAVTTGSAVAGTENITKTVFLNEHGLQGSTTNNGITVADTHTLTMVGGTISGFATALTVNSTGTLTLGNVTFENNTTADVANAGTMNIHGSVTMQKLTGDGTTDIQSGAVLNLGGDDYTLQSFTGLGTLNFKGVSSVAADKLGTATNIIETGKTLTLSGGSSASDYKTLNKPVSGGGSIKIETNNFVQADAANLQVAVENNGNLKLNSANEMTLQKDITGNGTLEFAKYTHIYGDIKQDKIIIDAETPIDVYTSLEATTSIVNHGSIMIDAGALKSDVTNDGSGTYADVMDNGAVYLYNSGTEASSTLTKKITNGKVILMADAISKLENLVNTGVYLAGGTNLTLKETETTEKTIGINIKGYEALYTGAGTGTLIAEGKYNATMDNIQTPLDNRGTMNLSKAVTGDQIADMSKMTSIVNSGTLNIGEGITLNKNISNSGTLKIANNSKLSNNTLTNSGTVDMTAGASFDGTAKVVGGTLKLGAIQFSNANIQGLAELDVTNAIYNFNANLTANPSVELIDANKVTGTLKLGVITATVNNSLDDWGFGVVKNVPYIKQNDDNNVTIDNSVFVFSDNSKYTFAQAEEGGSAKIGYMSIKKETGGPELWQIIRAKDVGGYNAGNVASFNLADDYTVDLTGADAPTDELGTLARVGETKRTFTINGNNHIFDGNNNKGITVNSGDVLNLNNISEIKGWQNYVVYNKGVVNFNNTIKLSSPLINTSGTLNFNGTTEVNGIITGNGTFNNNGELTVANLNNLGSSVTVLHNKGIVNIGSDTDVEASPQTLDTKIDGGLLGIKGFVQADADKLAANNINIAAGKTLTVNGSTALGEMRIINQGTLKLNIANNNASIIGGTVDVNANLTTKMDNLMANVINIADGKTLSVAADAREGKGYLSSIRTVNGTNGILEVTEGNLYATKEINSKIVLDDNAEPSKAAKLTIGPENIKNTVKVMGNANLYLTDGNLGASTIDSTSTGMVNFAGNITVATGTRIPKATFANGSVVNLTVTEGGDAPLKVINEINVEDNAKINVEGASKGGTYKVFDVTGITDPSVWAVGNICGEDANGHKVKGKEYVIDSGVYSVLFKTAMPENTDLGKLLENADGTPLADWAEKVYDYFDTAYGDAGEAYTANAINSMASASVLAGAQKGAATMVTQVAGNISANVGVGARPTLSGVRGQVSGVRNVSADVKLASPLEGKRADKGAWSGEGVDETAINTVEVGKASEVMPTEYKDKVYDKQVWASYIHSKQKIDGLKAGSLTQNSTIQLNGVTVGADLWSGKKSFGGLAITYADGNANSAQMSNSTKNEAKYYGISMYHRQDMGKYALTTDIGYTYNKNDITQHTTGITDEVTSKPKTHAYTVGMKLEREIYLSKACKIVPFAGARYTRLQNRDFSNSLGANTKVDNQNLVTVPVGLSFHSHLITTEGWKLGSILEGGYEWNFGNRHSTQEFGYGGAYNSIGFDVVDRGQYFVKAALTADYENMFFELGYRYSKGKSVRDNKWNFNANFIF